MNSRRVDLLDLSRLETQLVGLERRTSRAGRDVVDHPPGGHDDLANAAAGALTMASSAARSVVLVGTIAGDGSGGRVSWREVNRHGEPRTWSRRYLTEREAMLLSKGELNDETGHTN